jgi:CheY-like chemotaxis protein
MTTEIIKRKSFLFVDDDAAFLTAIEALFSELSGGNWRIFTAENHAQALALLGKQPVDVVVLDIGMPVLDGIQFLQLLLRSHPGQQVVMLTGQSSEERRKTCLESGAALFLEKPANKDGFAAIFAALEALAAAQPQAGFRGLMRRVGLHEVLQMECLGRKSSVMEVFTGKARGRIFICEGEIVHAESGVLQGEVALYGLLALRTGQFNLLPFSEPPRRTIESQWESLLMEAARLHDEDQQLPAPVEAGHEVAAPMPVSVAVAAPEAPPPGEVRLEEIILCTGAGEVLYEWQSQSLEARLSLLEQVGQEATQVSSLARMGRFERLEILIPEGRIVCQVQPGWRLFVRSSKSATAVA